jgi:hypothetical protein
MSALHVVGVSGEQPKGNRALGVSSTLCPASSHRHHGRKHCQVVEHLVQVMMVVQVVFHHTLAVVVSCQRDYLRLSVVALVER